MKYTYIILITGWMLASARAIIVRDDDYQISSIYDRATQRPESYSQEEADDEISRRRHKKRRRPCASNKVAPDGKTLVNIYYSEVDVKESNNYVSGGYGCPPGIGLADDDSGINRPRPSFSSSRPGVVESFLSNVLFGSTKPLDEGSSSADEDTSSTGPLGGTIPEELRFSRRSDFNPRRLYRQFNRELDRFLRPLYRLF